MDILSYQSEWLLKTGRIKDPARGTRERQELVDAFMKATVGASVKNIGESKLKTVLGK